MDEREQPFTSTSAGDFTPLPQDSATVPRPPGEVPPVSPPPAWTGGHPTAGAALPPRNTVMVVTAKSPGIAVLLSFLWLGAGNLYVNQIGAGIALLIVNFFLILLAATLFGAFLAVPVWILLFAVAAATSASEANRQNRLHGA